MLWTLLGIVVAVYVVVAPGLGVAAYWRLRRLERDLAALRAAPGTPTADVAAAPPAAERPKGWPAPDDWPRAASTDPPTGLETQAPESRAPEARAPNAQAPRATPPRVTLEERLTRRWLVWLGAATMALAAVFLVKYAVEQDLLRPTARITAGIALGVALIVLGEALRRRSPGADAAHGLPDQVPAAPTAAGLFALFASSYAAYALYGLIEPWAAYPLLGLTALSAIALAPRFGPLVAVLGLVAGYATPLLIETAEPASGAVFALLGVLTVAIAWLLSRVAWRRSVVAGLHALTLLGAIGWPLFWSALLFEPGDAAVIGPYLVIVAAAGTLGQAASPAAATSAFARWRRYLADLVWPTLTALAMLALTLADGHGEASLASIGVLTVAGSALALLRPRHEAVLGPLVVLLLALFATWALPDPLIAFPVETGPWAAPLLPGDLGIFALNALAYALFFGLGGFLVLNRGERPALWAWLSGGMPLALLAIAYWRFTGLAIDQGWATLALAAAGLVLIAARLAPARVDQARADAVQAAYAAAVTAALALALTMALREAWLTVALALEVAGLGWVALRLSSPRLRQLAFLLTLAVLARLTLNPYLLDYGDGSAIGWVLYGYGLSALALLAGARLFQRRRDDWLVALLDGEAIALLALMLTLEIQLVFVGDVASWPESLLAISLQTTAWLAIATALAHRHPWFDRPVVVWSRRLLAGLALVQALALQVVVLNPLWWPADVGDHPLFNLLAIAYALPAVLAATYARRERASGPLSAAFNAAALILAFVWVSLSVRQVFHGGDLSSGGFSDGEWLSYSAAWLGFAAAVLALGIKSRSTALRWTSLALVLASIAKVFLFDMNDLEGLWRVASFLGLGLSLVGIGLVYQRFVFPLGRRPEARPA